MTDPALATSLPEPTREAQRETCPVCSSTQVRRLRTLQAFPSLHCLRCSHDWLLTEGADLSSLYDMHYSGFREDRVFSQRVREVLRSKIAPHLPHDASVLDVGCGNGEFLAAAKELGYRTYGIDFAEAASVACNARGLKAVAGDFLRHDFGADAPFDLITMWDVCEHLDQPLPFVARARELLKPGGMLVLKVPCVTARAMALVQRVPRLAGPILSAPFHIQYFRPEGLVQMLERAGFSAVKVENLEAMRSRPPAKNALAQAKRGVLGAINRYCGNSNALVLARTAAS
jgi:2-polyprenyl-3-methyl-5-hydroxy-6-metoxy-1,4-benzoquinol methylase